MSHILEGELIRFTFVLRIDRVDIDIFLNWQRIWDSRYNVCKLRLLREEKLQQTAEDMGLNTLQKIVSFIITTSLLTFSRPRKYE